MKFKALFLALAVAGVGASFGLTDTGRSDTGTTTGATTTGATTTDSTTTTTSSDGCRKFELKGTFASVSSSSFSVNVTKGNKTAQGAVGTAVTVAVAADTKVSWSGRGTLTGPNAGDSVQVNGKQCGTTLTASKVEARGASKESAAKNADANKGDSGSQSGSEGKKKSKK
jgi:hypothetical protein